MNDWMPAQAFMMTAQLHLSMLRLIMLDICSFFIETNESSSFVELIQTRECGQGNANNKIICRSNDLGI